MVFLIDKSVITWQITASWTRTSFRRAELQLREESVTRKIARAGWWLPFSTLQPRAYTLINGKLQKEKKKDQTD